MTFWQKYVEEPRAKAKAIQEFAHPGNFEVPITYELIMAQSNAAEEVLKRHHLLNKESRHIQERIGLPNTAD